MKYDYFAGVYNRHKDIINQIIKDAENNKNVKLRNCRAEWKENIKTVKVIELKALYNEPIKTHLLFCKLQKGQDNSWKNVFTDFYIKKVEDFNNELSRNILDIFRKKTTPISFIKELYFKITLISNFYTASDNKFYSIANPLATERPTGLPLIRGSSLKGALRQAAIDLIEDELIEENYGEKFKNYESQDIASIEQEEERQDRFFFKKREKLVQIFGNEKDTKWFTFKSLLATGGIKDVNKIEQVLNKINDAFEHYLKKHKVINPDGFCRGRFIFEDLYFKKVGLDVITPLGRKKRTPVSGPISYEVVPAKTEAEGRVIWFPFALVVKGVSQNEIDEEWKEDKEWIEKAFNRLSQIGVGAKTKDGWGRFKWEEK